MRIRPFINFGGWHQVHLRAYDGLGAKRFGLEILGLFFYVGNYGEALSIGLTILNVNVGVNIGNWDFGEEAMKKQRYVVEKLDDDFYFNIYDQAANPYTPWVVSIDGYQLTEPKAHRIANAIAKMLNEGALK